MKFSNAIVLAAIVACAGLPTSAVAEKRVQMTSPAAAAAAGVESSKFLETSSVLRRRHLRKLQDEDEMEELDEPDDEPENEMEEDEPEIDDKDTTEEEEEIDDEEPDEDDESEDEPEEKEDDESEEEAAVPANERECERFTDRVDQFEFECNALATEGQQVIEDNLKFRVITGGNGLVIKVSYEQETETETTETETEMGFDVRFDKLIEYKKGTFTETDADDEDEQDEIEVTDAEMENEMDEDVDEDMETENEMDEDTETPDADEGDEEEDIPVAEARQAAGGSSPVDNAYQWDMDTIIQEWDIEDWADLTPVTESSSGNLLTFSATALGGIAQFTFTISQATEGALSANSMKID
ncbi:MAG: hypothetical protein SGARI_005090, partial [Bacillariaceae sp.]